MSGIRKKKITSKLIEDNTQRKICYKNRLKGLFTKMEQLTTICGIEACAVVFGPGDIKPSMWPSLEVATELITKFESMSLSVRLKKRTDKLTFVEEKGKKLEASLEKINKDNEETLMGAYMHQIENEGKSLDDFDNDVKNRLINFVLEKIKINRKRCRYFDNNPGNNMEIPPLTNLGGDMLFYQDNFVGFDNNIGSNMEMPPRENPTSDVDATFSHDNLGDFDDIMEIPSHENYNGNVDDMFLPRGNLGHFNNNTGSNIWISSNANPSGSVDNFLPQENLGGQENFGAFDDNMWIPLANLSGGDDTLLPQDNFGGFNNTHSNTWIPPHENPNGDANMLLPQCNYGGQGNFEHFDNNTASSMWIPSHEKSSGGVDTFLPQGNSRGQVNFADFDNNSGSDMWMPPHTNRSSGGDDEMAILHQNNFGGNTNGDGTGSSNTSFVDKNYGRYFDNGLPSE